MVCTALEAFRHKVWSDKALQSELLAVSEEAAFIARVVELGRACGYEFTATDVRDAMNRAQRAWIERNLPYGQPEIEEQAGDAETDHSPDAFAGWLPIDFHFRRGRPGVEWCHFSDTRLKEPFFVDSIHRHMAHPFNRLFRRYTSLETLAALQEECPGLKPSGLIFHLSRCGSTLISQMLGSLPDTVMLSEPEPLNSVLSARWKVSGVSDEESVQWLRLTTSAMGQPRHGEKHLFIKLDSWHMLEWRLIEQAFPGVPWIFLYREPLEIMVSHARHPGSQMIAGVVEPSWFGWHWSQVIGLSREEYGARVLTRICEAALDAIRHSEYGRLVNYTELPNVVWDELPSFFDFPLDATAKEHLLEAGGRNAKVPDVPFAADSTTKRQEATPELRGAVEEHVRALYDQLELARCSA